MTAIQTTINTPLGNIIITSNGSAITSILFSDEGVVINTTEDDLLLQAVGELNEYFSGQRTAFTFPTAQSGTEFQQKVWQQLQTIPCGKTISYRQLAIQLGDVKCIRAAGTANGKNKLAIVVPCHRVIGSDGALVGYAGGLWRKMWLLDHEARMHGKAMQASMF